MQKQISPKRRRPFLHFCASATITAILLYAVFREEGLESFYEFMIGVNLKGVWIYIMIACAALYLRALRYRWILCDALEGSTCPGISKLLIVTAIRNALVDFLPARLGELSFFYVISRYGVPVISAITTFGLCIALDLIVLLLLFALLVMLTPLGSFIVSGAGTSGSLGDFRYEILALVLLLALTLFAVALYYLDRILVLVARVTRWFSTGRQVSRWQALVKLCHALVSGCERIAQELARIRQRGSYTKLVIITAFLRVAKYGSLYILLISVVEQYGIGFGSLNPLLTTFAFVGAEASASLPISGLMGFGAYEGTWSVIFSFSNIEIPQLPRVILLIHLITQVVGYSLAFLALGVFLCSQTSKSPGSK